MKPRPTLVGPNLPRAMEILHNHPERPCIPAQQDPAPIDLQRICKVLIRYQQEKRAHDSRKNAMALPSLHIGQDVSYITSQGDWLPGKITQISLDPICYIVTTPTGTINRHNRRKLKGLHWTTCQMP